ncbi:MAG TPA: response regulator [Steroidobacteraceae bacterium]
MDRELPHVLIVEDSDTQALQLASLLEAEGIRAHRAATAEQALEHLGRERPDLLLVDYHLPRMHGDELCRRIRMNPATSDILVLMLTDDTQGMVERQGLASGADDHVPKSADADALMARVHALLRTRRTAVGAAGRPGSYLRRHRVVVVDDSPTYLAYVEKELGQEGYAVVALGSSRDALEHLRQTGCDCILIDLVMPDIDGIELCRHLDLIRERTGSWFPVLMVTSRDSKEDMMRALEAGADDFVSKSNDPAILKARIQALLRRKMQRDEHERIGSEFRDKELEVVRERTERQAAERRAALAEELQETNRELKETQSQLVQAAKMASLGELVAGIAHEINNPLAYVMSYLDTVDRSLGRIAEKTDRHLPPAERARLDKARARLGDMRGGLERVGDLVSKLRTFSRLDEGAFKRTDARESIESVLTILGHRLHDKIAVRTSYAADNMIACFPAPLNQVVMNLLGNAIDAVATGGLIEVRTERDDTAFRIVVADSGPGVAPEIRDRVFEPFFTTKPVGKGVGLGLAISYRIVQAHKGEITIHERTGGGAEIVVTIPLHLGRTHHAH